MRILGIDYGTKRIGVSIGDTDAKTAVPFAVFETRNLKLETRNIVDKIVKIVKEEGVELVVVGQGGKGPMEAKVQEFVKELRKYVKVEIADEHFTTAQIERTMKNYGRERRKIDKDSAAAALILQGWLEGHDA
ncbi:Holliday junction resolvase RuvX [Candidatus Uhrbacteria bacterium]|nr:Holliday junction resolvase RuvX [Candidatus Uhrbacteria bacterium]